MFCLVSGLVGLADLWTAGIEFGFRVVVMMRCGLFGVLLLVVLRLRVCGVWLG